MITSKDFEVPKFPVVAEVQAPARGRLIAIGDVHGCVEELDALLRGIEPVPEDLLMFCGDLVDRGPASDEVLETVMELCLSRPGTHCVMGNHEEKHVRYRRWLHLHKETGAKNPMRLHPNTELIHHQMRDPALVWTAGLPAGVVIELNIFNGAPAAGADRFRIVTHAGLRDGTPWRQETKALIRNRYMKPRGDGTWAPTSGRNPFVKPEGSVSWDEAWTGPRVLYGHIVHSLENVRVVNDCWGLDTGACFGGHLSAYVEDLETNAVVIHRVKAARTYFDNSRGKE